MELSTPLKFVKGIGPILAKKLERLNLLTVEDIIHHYPYRYDDFSQVGNASQANLGQNITLQGEVWSIKNIFTRYGRVLTQAIFNDGTTPITLTWFNQSWLTKQIQTGDKLQVSGKLTKYKNKLTIVAPSWEKLENPKVAAQSTSEVAAQTLHTGRLVPVYPETYGLTSKWIRVKIDQIYPQVIDQIKDPLSEKVRDQMLPLADTLQKIHFPQTLEEANKARERLSFDELFYIALATQKVRIDWQKKPTIKPFKVDKKLIDNFINGLAFRLTQAQDRVIQEILEDLKKDQPMNRLVQGEVGSGKTIVATIIIYLTFLNRAKTLYMAPTEILAFQHYETVKKFLEPFGVKVGIYTGSRKMVNGSSFMVNRKDKKDKSPINDKRSTISDVIIGTHALLSDKLLIDNVGLVIVDEQQRFGVEQRTLLRSKAKVPHFLTMTATPIPRTVALCFYGDLDLSIIDELPVGRIPVKTHVVPAKKRSDAYKFIEKKVKMGGQVYIITPLIEQSETLASVKAAKIEFEKLQKEVFLNLKLGLLHGRLKSKDKEKVITDFRNRKINILVSTSVVEVGMDIPNATIMVIEGAERFGLSQLHQLRGRVGRSEKESFCLLFPSIEDPNIIRRLKHLEKTFDGLKLSELDLKIRGAGEIFGVRQAGRFELKVASLTDLPLIEKTRAAARRILSDDPALAKHPELKIKLQSISGLVMPD